MKKLLASITLLSLTLFTSQAQDNKAEANSFGIQYGISYGGILGQSVIFSGWLSKGIEVRGGFVLSFAHTDNKSGDSSNTLGNNNNIIPVYLVSESKSGSLTLTPDISVLKHFATKSNIDPFIGVLMSDAVNFQTIQSQSIVQTTGENFYRYVNQLSKTPVINTVGLSLVGGINYFFVKNFAIGVDVGFGFTTAITSGKRYATSIEYNSGSNNGTSGNQTNTTVYNTNVLTYNVNLTGNGGLRLTYYLKTHPLRTTTVTPTF